MNEPKLLSALTVERESGWISRGRIGLFGEKLQFDLKQVPDEAGLYRLEFDPQTLYFGEAGDLRRRLGDYLKYYAATGIESEFRINRALHQFKGADVAIITGESFKTRSQRCTIEAQLIKAARADSSIALLNGGSIPDRIAFHAAEIMRLSTKLTRSKVESEVA